MKQVVPCAATDEHDAQETDSKATDVSPLMDPTESQLFPTKNAETKEALGSKQLGWLLTTDHREIDLHPARIGWAKWIKGTRTGQLTFMLSIGFGFVLLGTFGWTKVGPNADFDTTWWHAMCMSWYMFIDVGTQTGISPNDPGKVLSYAVSLSACGFLFNLVLFGYLVEIVRRTLDKWIKEHHCIVLSEHTVVLGWTDKTLFLLRERLDAAEDMGLESQEVVVVADRDEIEMSNDVKDFLHDKLHQHVIHCIRGHPSNPNDLRRASISSARDIIALGRSGDPHESDLEVMRIMVAVGSMQESINGKIIVEVRCEETIPKVDVLLPNALGIPARYVVNHILCLLATWPSLGILATSICGFEDGFELYTHSVKSLVGQTFRKASEYFKTARCVGIYQRHGNIMLAPSDDYVVQEEDAFIVLAADLHSIRALTASSSWFSARAWTSSVSGAASLFHKQPKAAFKHSFMKTTKLAKDLSQKGTKVMIRQRTLALKKRGEMQRPSVHLASDRTFVIAGWPDDFGDIVELLDTYVPPGTFVHVLSDKSIEERKKELLGRSRLKRIEMHHHVGDRTSACSLAKLPLWQAAAIFVLAEGVDQNQARITATRSDTECLACVLTICGLVEGRYDKRHAGPLAGHIVCEVLDPRTDRLLTRNARLTSMCWFFRSNGLETGMFAMAAADPIMFNVFALLLTPNDFGELALEPIQKYFDVNPASDDAAILPFDDLQTRVRGPNGADGILIGWQPHDAITPLLWVGDDRLRLRPWNAGDKVLIIRRLTDAVKQHTLQPDVCTESSADG